MFRKTILLIVILLFNKDLSAQQLIPLDEVSYLKQINTKIETTKNDSLRLSNYLLLSEYWAQTDSLKSWDALNNVITSPQKKSIPKGIIDYYLGYFHTYHGDKKTALKHYINAISLIDKDSKNRDLYIKSLYNNAYIQVEDKGYDFMVKTLTEQCIPLCEKSGYTELSAYFYTQLGLTFMSVGQFDKAEQYHKKALENLKSLPTPNTVHLLTYLNLVSNYCYKPDSKSAKIYLDKAKDLIKQYPNSLHYANFYYQEAMYYTTKQAYDSALISLSKGVDFAKQKQQSKLLHMLYFRIYNVYLMQKDYQKAKVQLEQILQENILSREAVNRKITYTQLAAVNEVLGDYKQAYNWMRKSGILNDSLQQQKLLEKMNELEILHKTADKQHKIDSLEKEKAENELIVKNKNLRTTILGVALGLSLIVAFLSYVTYKNQQKLTKEISISHQQDLLHLENERKYEATKAILQGEEQERHRIAQDLHDSMGGMLANIRMSISSLNPDKSNEIYKKIDKSISEMRRISRNLMPETLKNLGLEIALKELCESMSQKHFFIQFEAFNISNEIQFQSQLTLYRITQESISNVIKHAQANNVIVQISQYENTLNLTIEDDGIGFDKSKIVYGMGLRNIENRVRLINGTVDILSSNGNGTTINITCDV